MEAIITVVGFLGSGKTTLLKHLATQFLAEGWNPYIILNDYENANLDAQQFLDQVNPDQLMPLNGSCICCSGIGELRYFVNSIPERNKGITLIEANGTSDACSLMGFLGIGIDERFLPPVQVSVVDVKNWQRRAEHNELERNQIQVSSLIVLTHIDGVKNERKQAVIQEIKTINPKAEITTMEDIKVNLLPKLMPSKNKALKLDHLKAHWSSCSIDLPHLPHAQCIYDICDALPSSILRVKGCTQIGDEPGYTFFQRTPDGEVNIRPFNGVPTTGPKLLSVGPGSSFELLELAVRNSRISRVKGEPFEKVK